MSAASTPLVSVVVPAYNYARFIGETLASVQAQTLDGWECIVIDDGSTDDTAQVVAEIARRDPRIVYQHQANAGLSAARNAGLERARGRYVQFLDADDLIEPRKLATQVEYLERNPEVGLVYSDVRYFPSEDPAALRRSMFEPDHAWMPMVSGRGGGVVAALVDANIMVVNSPLVRRSLIDRVGVFETSLRALEDWDYWIRCALSGARFEYLEAPEGRARVRVHAASMSRDRLMMARVQLQVRRRHAGRFPPGEPSRRNRMFMARDRATAGAALVAQGDPSGKREIAAAAWEARGAESGLKYLLLSQVSQWVPVSFFDEVAGMSLTRVVRRVAHARFGLGG